MPAPPLPHEMPHGLTRPGSVMGTPYYISPEQARGEVTDFRADQYALGCIFYEMLAGRVPFDDETLDGLLRKQMHEPPRPPSQLVPERNIPPALDALVLRLLAKSPEQRFPSMQAVAQTIDQVLGPAPTRPRHRRWTVILATLLSGSLLLGGGLAAQLLIAKKTAPTTSWQPAPGELAAAEQQARSVLRQQLIGPDREQRLGVLFSLAQCRDATFVPDLETLSQDPDPELAARAAVTLGQLGDRRAIATLRRRLDSVPLAVRLGVARALADLGDDSGQKTLTAVLRSPDRAQVPAALQLKAAYLLCDADELAAQQLLFALAELRTTPEDTVLDILSCLGKSPRAALARSKLVARFHAQSGSARIPIAARLAQLGEPEALDFLRNQARQPGPERPQLVAACALAAPDEPELAPLFRRTLESSRDAETRLQATTGLGLTGELRDVPLLVAQLAKESAPSAKRTTAAAILTLCSRAPTALDTSSLHFINQALADPSWMVRADAVAALSQSADGAAVQLLARMLGDSSAVVRSAAARAVGRRHEHSALLALRAGLQDRDASVRTEILKALARIGTYLKAHGFGSIAKEITGWFASDSGLAIPAWQKAALLLVLGDESPAAQLDAHPELATPVGQSFLLDLGWADRAWLLTCLQSSDLEIQLAAAGRLAENKDAAGRTILDAAIGRGGAVAIKAYGILAMLGEPVPEAPLQAGIAAGSPLVERLAVVAAAAALPPQRAVTLWQKAAYDPDRTVRRAVITTIAEVKSSAQQQQAIPVLRTLLRDSDLGTRAQSAALLAQLLRSAESPSKTPTETLPAALPSPDRDPADMSPPVPPPDAADGAALAVADPLGGAAPLQLETALREGLLASRRQDFARAQKLLVRARSLCLASHPPPERCRTLIPEATLQLAQNYDKQNNLPQALTEYQRLLSDRSFRSAELNQQLVVQTAVMRLTGILGKVVISTNKGSRCQHEIHWLREGPGTVIVNGKPTPVHVVAGQTHEVGDCK